MTDDRPVLNQINFVVRDMDAMLAFYSMLGVDIPPANPPWGQHHHSASTTSGLDLDFDSTAFAAKWDEGWPAGHTGPVIGFSFPTRAAVDTTYAKLIDAGYTGQQPPWDAFFGARYAVVVDPENNIVGLMSPVDPARRWSIDPPSA